MWAEIVGKGFVFQQDNDPKHASKLCINYNAKKEKQTKKCNTQSGLFNLLTWTLSNTLWDKLDRNARKIESKTTLGNFCKFIASCYYFKFRTIFHTKIRNILNYTRRDSSKITEV